MFLVRDHKPDECNFSNLLHQQVYQWKFLDYGTRIFEYNQHVDTHIDLMDDVFPKIKKRQLNRHSPGGDI